MAIIATAMPFVKMQFFVAGVPAAGYQLQTFVAGTTTPQATYTDSTSGIANANPIILDSSGMANVFLTPSLSYKFILAPPGDTFPASSPSWTEDNISGVPLVAANADIPATFSPTVTAGQVVFLSDGSGGNVAGLWYVADSANNYSSTTAPMVGFVLGNVSAGGSGSVRLAGHITGLTALSSGTTYFIGTAGALTASAPANARPVLVADTTTSGNTLITPLLATTTVPGLISIGTQSIAGNKTFTGVVVVQGNLTTNGNFSYVPGASATQIPPSGVISAQVSIAGVPNVSTTETTLFTFPLPASVLNAAGKGIRVTAYGTVINNANTKTVKAYFGGTSSGSGGMANAAIGWIAIWEIYYVTNTTQVGRLMINRDATGGTSYGTLSPTETLSGTVTIKITGTGGASNDILGNGLLVEPLGA